MGIMEAIKIIVPQAAQSKLKKKKLNANLKLIDTNDHASTKPSQCMISCFLIDHFISTWSFRIVPIFLSSSAIMRYRVTQRPTMTFRT